MSDENYAQEVFNAFHKHTESYNRVLGYAGSLAEIEPLMVYVKKERVLRFLEDDEVEVNSYLEALVEQFTRIKTHLFEEKNILSLDTCGQDLSDIAYQKSLIGKEICKSIVHAYDSPTFMRKGYRADIKPISDEYFIDLFGLLSSSFMKEQAIATEARRLMGGSSIGLIEAIQATFFPYFMRILNTLSALPFVKMDGADAVRFVLNIAISASQQIAISYRFGSSESTFSEKEALFNRSFTFSCDMAFKMWKRIVFESILLSYLEMANNSKITGLAGGVTTDFNVVSAFKQHINKIIKRTAVIYCDCDNVPENISHLFEQFSDKLNVIDFSFSENNLVRSWLALYFCQKSLSLFKNESILFTKNVLEPRVEEFHAVLKAYEANKDRDLVPNIFKFNPSFYLQSTTMWLMEPKSNLDPDSLVVIELPDFEDSSKLIYQDLRSLWKVIKING